MARGAALAAALLVQMHAMHAAAFTVQALGVRQPGCALAPRLALSRRSGVRAAHPTMGLVEAANSFPWALIPGTVAAGILFREGGLGSIGAFIDETFDYLDQKGGYIITEEQLKGAQGQAPKLDVEGIDEAFNRPKRAISSQSIWLLISMMISAPVLAWVQAAVNGKADMMHLDKF